MTKQTNASVMTVSETAKYMGIGRKVVYQLIEMGEIHATRERGAVLVFRDSIESFRSSGKLT